MLKPEEKPKSPLTLSFFIACLLIGTMVMISHYFFRPGLEMDLENRVVNKLHSYNLLNPVIKVEGRDVVLNGVVPNKNAAAKIEAEVENISGIHNVESQLFIQNQSD